MPSHTEAERAKNKARGIIGFPINRFSAGVVTKKKTLQSVGTSAQNAKAPIIKKRSRPTSLIGQARSAVEATQEKLRKQLR